MTTSEFVVLIVALVGSVTAIIGVQVRLMSAMGARIERLEAVVDTLSTWHHDWTPPPADMPNMISLDRRLFDIETRLAHIEVSIRQESTK